MRTAVEADEPSPEMIADMLEEQEGGPEYHAGGRDHSAGWVNPRLSAAARRVQDRILRERQRLLAKARRQVEAEWKEVERQQAVEAADRQVEYERLKVDEARRAEEIKVARAKKAEQAPDPEPESRRSIEDDELLEIVSEIIREEPDITRSGIVKRVREDGHSAGGSRIRAAFEAYHEDPKPARRKGTATKATTKATTTKTASVKASTSRVKAKQADTNGEEPEVEDEPEAKPARRRVTRKASAA